jgi:hypothetical protein
VIYIENVLARIAQVKLIGKITPYKSSCVAITFESGWTGMALVKPNFVEIRREA